MKRQASVSLKAGKWKKGGGNGGGWREAVNYERHERERAGQRDLGFDNLQFRPGGQPANRNGASTLDTPGSIDQHRRHVRRMVVDFVVGRRGIRVSISC